MRTTDFEVLKLIMPVNVRNPLAEWKRREKWSFFVILMLFNVCDYKTDCIVMLVQRYLSKCSFISIKKS